MTGSYNVKWKILKYYIGFYIQLLQYNYIVILIYYTGIYGNWNKLCLKSGLKNTCHGSPPARNVTSSLPPSLSPSPRASVARALARAAAAQ